jgi:hypothetical protein
MYIYVYTCILIFNCTRIVFIELEMILMSIQNLEQQFFHDNTKLKLVVFLSIHLMI